MPTFSMAGSMESCLNSGRVFDVRTTPSQMGVISETFRKREGVLRSLHPTHSVAGWGKDAECFLRDHDKSPTPFGYDTPFGRAAEDADTYILMIETHIHSLLHHLQERAAFPDLFLPGLREVPVIGWNGDRTIISTRVMRPRTPYFIAIPSSRPETCAWVILHDFGLIFPHRRLGELKEMGYLLDGYPGLLTRREQLERAGIFRSLKVGRGEVGLLHIRGFLREVEPELRGLLAKFSHCYDTDEIDALNLPYSCLGPMKILFFILIFLTAYSFVVYPAVLLVISRLVRRPWQKGEIRPSVTVIVSAHNEEAVIAQKVRNCLALDYPEAGLDIMVVSDGSTDRTDEIVSSIKDRRVTLAVFPRLGKTACLNRVVPSARGEICVFTDANSMFPPHAPRDRGQKPQRSDGRGRHGMDGICGPGKREYRDGTLLRIRAMDEGPGKPRRLLRGGRRRDFRSP